jgi:predicted amidohydrolase
MFDKIKIAGVQMEPKLMKIADNLEKIMFLIKKAATENANLIVFPECALTGYVFSSRQEASPFLETIPGPSTKEIAVRCRELGVYVIVGLLEKDADKCFNAAALIGPQGVVEKYRKIHLPCLGVDRFLNLGDRPFSVHKTPIGNIGIHICYDALFPESSRIMALLGADILVLPTNWPEGRERYPNYVVNTRACENRVHFVAVNRIGEERGSRFIGRSKIVGASGDTLIEAYPDKEQIIYAEVSLSQARQKNVVFIAGESEFDPIHDRRPELYVEISRSKVGESEN